MAIREPIMTTEERVVTTDPMMTRNHMHHDCSMFHRISWTAIFVGALVAVGLGFLLSLFSVAIGLSAFSMDTNTGANALAWGGFAGYVIGIIASMVAAGYAAGYLGRMYCPQRNLGIVYGFATWTVALLLTAAVTSHMGNYVTNYTSNMAGNRVTSAVVTPKNDMTPLTTTVNGTPVKAGDTENNVKAQVQTGPNQTMTMSTSTESLAMSAALLFALFFIGALSACLGAHWGMCCRRED